MVTGKPVELGGALGRVEATGRGVSLLAFEELRHLGITASNARVVIQGFGNVGSVAAKMFADRGCKVIAISDVSGAYLNNGGINVSLMRSPSRKSIAASKAIPAPRPFRMRSYFRLLHVECDVLVPAALEKVLTLENARAFGRS